MKYLVRHSFLTLLEGYSLRTIVPLSRSVVFFNLATLMNTCSRFERMDRTLLALFDVGLSYTTCCGALADAPRIALSWSPCAALVLGLWNRGRITRIPKHMDLTRSKRLELVYFITSVTLFKRVKITYFIHNFHGSL